MKISICFMLFYLLFLPFFAYAHEIHLDNGKIILTENCWEERGKIAYELFGATIYVDKSKVVKIIKQSQEEYLKQQEEKKNAEKQYNTNGALVFLKDGRSFFANKTWFDNGILYCETKNNKTYHFKEDQISQVGNASSTATSKPSSENIATSSYTAAVQSKYELYLSFIGKTMEDVNRVKNYSINVSNLHCKFKCSDSRINEAIKGFNLFTIGVEDYRIIMGYAQVIVEARIIAEDLMKASLNDKYGRLETYYKQILEVIPCMYYSSCDIPPIIREDIAHFKAAYYSQWKALQNQKEQSKLISSKTQYDQKLMNNNSINGKTMSLSDTFKTALELYHNQNYKEANGLFSTCIANQYDLKNSFFYRGASYYNLAAKKESTDKDRDQLGVYAKFDLDQSILKGENTGLAHITRAKLNFYILTFQDGDKTGSAVYRDLDTVIGSGSQLAGEACYLRAKAVEYYAEDPIAANRYMTKAADLGYNNAIKIISENPLWPSFRK